MKAFRFELESLLVFRKNIEKQKQADVALISSKYNKEQMGKENCLSKINDSIQKVDSIENKDDMIENFMFVNDYISSLGGQIRLHEDNMQVINVELKKKQKILAKASADLKAVEMLKDKKLAEYKKEVIKEEQKIFDEWKNGNNIYTNIKG